MTLMPYPCSQFCGDFKFDIRFYIRSDIKLGDSVHVNHTINFVIKLISYRPVASGGAGGALASPVFGRSIHPISTRVGTLSPPITTSPPGFSDLATALQNFRRHVDHL